MKTWILSVIVLLPISGTLAGESSSTIRLWPTATVVHDEIVLADLCDWEGFDADTETRLAMVTVCAAPPPGGSLAVSWQMIREAMASGGINSARTTCRGAARCAVTRPKANAPPQRTDEVPRHESSPSRTGTLRDAVHAALNGQLGAYEGRLELEFGATAAALLELTGPEFEFSVHIPSGRVLGLVNVEVDVLRNGVKAQSAALAVNARLIVPIVVARRPINAQAAVHAEDVELVEKSFVRLDSIGMARAEEVIGRQARRFIPAGTTLVADDFDIVPLVKRGQLVEVYSRAGGVLVETAARALGEGGFGDAVELRTTDKRRDSIHGVVTGPGRVEVRSPDSGNVELHGSEISNLKSEI